jgi:hypothetical protein
MHIIFRAVRHALIRLHTHDSELSAALFYIPRRQPDFFANGVVVLRLT